MELAQGISLNFGIQALLFNKDKRYKVNDNYEYYVDRQPDRRIFYVGLSIPFGNMKAKGASGRSSSSATVKNRLKD
ncbi:MAG: hypothetical protein LBB84_02160 [Tannerellaceae bacterium]|jgi:outer membrane usher protein FimD/PapC|nr:hypothetical protein [Tannerellaceae bacterium]